MPTAVWAILKCTEGRYGKAFQGTSLSSDAAKGAMLASSSSAVVWGLIPPRNGMVIVFIRNRIYLPVIIIATGWLHAPQSTAIPVRGPQVHSPASAAPVCARSAERRVGKECCG